MLIFSLSILAGIVLLIAGSDRFVHGSARLALAFKISPVVVGAIVIGFGTSSPELLVSSIAAAQGNLDIAVGAVIGSNIANLTLICGVAALAGSLLISSGTLKREMPLATLAVIFLALATQTEMNRFIGALLLLAFAAAIMVILRPSKGEDVSFEKEVEEFSGEFNIKRDIFWVIAGLIGTIGGAQALVWGAQNLALDLGMSEALVGLTIVAIGTSLPELATAIQAARKGETELIVGNLLGSNLFNSLAIVGVSVMIQPGKLPSDLTTLPVMIMVAVAIVVTIAAVLQNRISRPVGLFLLASYPAILLMLT